MAAVTNEFRDHLRNLRTLVDGVDDRAWYAMMREGRNKCWLRKECAKVFLDALDGFLDLKPTRPGPLTEARARELLDIAGKSTEELTQERT